MLRILAKEEHTQKRNSGFGHNNQMWSKFFAHL